MRICDESVPGTPIHHYDERHDILIGSSPLCTLRLAAASVSRIHALLYKDVNGCLRIRDLGSTQGTEIRGRFLDKGDEEQVQVGDLLLIGPHRLRIMDLSASHGESQLTFRPPPRQGPISRIVIWDDNQGTHMKIVLSSGASSNELLIPERENDVIANLLKTLVGAARRRPFFDQIRVPASSEDAARKGVQNLQKLLRTFQETNPAIKDLPNINLAERLRLLHKGYAKWDLNQIVEEVVISSHSPPTK